MSSSSHDDTGHKPAGRLLDRKAAAAYCSLSVSAFSNWVRAGKLPRPLPGTDRWDRKAIDLAIDLLSGIEMNTGTSALDDWKRKHARAPKRHPPGQEKAR